MLRVTNIVLRVMLPAIAVLLMSTPTAALPPDEWVAAFVRFIDWPMPAPDVMLTVCQQHDTPALALEGRQVRGLKLTVRRVVNGRDLSGCHVYAALASDETYWVPVLKAINQATNSDPTKALPILSIGEGAQFCDLGGAICVVRDAASGSETYRLNLDALSRARFRVDSQLLRAHPPRAARAGQRGRKL